MRRDPLHLAQGFLAMTDDQDGPSQGEPSDRISHQLLVDRVQAGRRLIQDHQRGLP
jgi:hypothetical protein